MENCKNSWIMMLSMKITKTAAAAAVTTSSEKQKSSIFSTFFFFYVRKKISLLKFFRCMHNKVFCFINILKKNAPRWRKIYSSVYNCFTLSITIRRARSALHSVAWYKVNLYIVTFYLPTPPSAAAVAKAKWFKVSFSWNETCLITKQMVQLNKLRMSTFILFSSFPQQFFYFLRGMYLHQHQPTSAVAWQKVNSGKLLKHFFLMMALRWWLLLGWHSRLS